MKRIIDWGKITPYVAAIGVFVLASLFYFPQVLGGKVIQQSDVSSWRGMSQEIKKYQSVEDEPVLWTNSMFSGMPSTMISMDYEGNLFQWMTGGIMKMKPIAFLVVCMSGFFFLLLVFGVNVWWAIPGAIASAFCAYNFQIIQVGHETKMLALSLLPWVFASVALAFRKNALCGAVLFALFFALELMANHIQVTYYLGFIVLFYGVGELVAAIVAKQSRRFLKPFVALLAGLVLALGVNCNRLWNSWEYAQQTMRGGTELVRYAEQGTERDGLDINYAMNWSYSPGELFNLLIPNFKGGSSGGALSEKSATYQYVESQAGASTAKKITEQLPLYWGDQAFTAGPMYMGAITIFLFVLALFVVRDRNRWWIAALTLLALLLSLGSHVGGLTTLFYKVVPLYNKFRVPSMILVTLQTLLPLLGFYALNQYYQTADKKAFSSALLKAGGVVGGLCFLFLLFPGLAGDFVSPQDGSYPEWLQPLLPQDRRSLLRADAFRSLLFIGATALLLWYGHSRSWQIKRVAALLALLVLFDMWGVDRRYLNKSHFVSERENNSQFAMQPVDKAILADKDPHYRVLDLSVNTFNDAHTSFYHKTIGGYSAAKLQRYQEVIDYAIIPEIQAATKIFNNEGSLDNALPLMKMNGALNAKYIILSKKAAPVLNPYALGNGWFVADYTLAEDADAELEGMMRKDPARTAVISESFASMVEGKTFTPDSDATITLLSYHPNRLAYRTESATEQIALFSEVYYPNGWRLTIDDLPSELFRSNYILRGAVIPAGTHIVKMEFRPASYFEGDAVSLASSLLLWIALLGLILAPFIPKIKKNREK